VWIGRHLATITPGWNNNAFKQMTGIPHTHQELNNCFQLLGAAYFKSIGMPMPDALCAKDQPAGDVKLRHARQTNDPVLKENLTS